MAAANRGVDTVVAGLGTAQADDRLAVTAGIGGGRQCDRCAQVAVGKDTHRAADGIAIDHTA